MKDKHGYLLPVDGSPNAAEEDGYPIDLLLQEPGELSRTRGALCGGVSGRLFFGERAPEGPLVRVLRVRWYVRAGAAEGALAKKVTALTACGADKQLASLGRERARHGLFTHHLLDALVRERRR